MHEDDLHQQSAFLPSPRDPSRRFSVVLLTIYSIENAGIRYVSAALQREGIDTTIVFLRDWVHNRLTMPSDAEFDHALEVVREKNADLVGVGFMSSLLPMARELTRRVKGAFPDVPVVWGGIHPTSDPQGSIHEADFVCRGEGEMAAVDLVKALAEGGDTTQIPNIWARVDDEIHENEPRPLLQNLDWLPYPDVRADNKIYIEGDRIRR